MVCGVQRGESVPANVSERFTGLALRVSSASKRREPTHDGLKKSVRGKRMAGSACAKYVADLRGGNRAGAEGDAPSS